MHSASRIFDIPHSLFVNYFLLNTKACTTQKITAEIHLMFDYSSVTDKTPATSTTTTKPSTDQPTTPTVSTNATTSSGTSAPTSQLTTPSTFLTDHLNMSNYKEGKQSLIYLTIFYNFNPII